MDLKKYNSEIILSTNSQNTQNEGRVDPVRVSLLRDGGPTIQGAADSNTIGIRTRRGGISPVVGIARIRARAMVSNSEGDSVRLHSLDAQSQGPGERLEADRVPTHVAQFHRSIQVSWPGHLSLDSRPPAMPVPSMLPGVSTRPPAALLPPYRADPGVGIEVHCTPISTAGNSP
jgi:hypothetical protein